MTPLAIVIACILSAAGGALGGGLVIDHRADEHEAELRAEHQVAVDQQRAEAQQLSAELGECQAHEARETLTGAGLVLEAAQLSEVEDLQLRAAVVAAIPQTLLAEAVVATGSPQSIAAYAALAGCWAANTTGDSARGGCATQVPQGWAAALAELAACPVVVE